MFLGGLTLLRTTRFLGLYPGSVAAEPPPETPKIRLGHSTALCVVPLYVAAELLPGQGFTAVQCIKTGQEVFAQAMAAGRLTSPSTSPDRFSPAWRLETP